MRRARVGRTQAFATPEMIERALFIEMHAFDDVLGATAHAFELETTALTDEAAAYFRASSRTLPA